MNTSPKDQQALTYNAPKRPDRQPTPGEVLWTVSTVKGALIRCELRNHGAAGAELQLFRNREFVDGRLWPSREIAVAKAEFLKADHLLCGATLVE